MGARWWIGAAIAAGIATAVGCGIPEENYNATLKDLQRCRARLANTRAALDRAGSAREDLKLQLAAAKGDKDALARQLGATEKELQAVRQARVAADERTRTFRELLSRLRAMIDSGQLNVKIRKGRMIVQMSDKILFDPGQTVLKEDGKQALTELARVLRDIGEREFLVAGHTDNVPIRTRRFGSNWELSAARAVEVVKFLQAQSVDPRQLVAAGYSEFDPVGDNADEEGRRSNRRIEIVLMPKLDELPPISE